MKRLIFALLAVAAMWGCGSSEQQNAKHYSITFFPIEGDTFESVVLAREYGSFYIGDLDYDDRTGAYSIKGTIDAPFFGVLLTSGDDVIAPLFVEEGDIVVAFDEEECSDMGSGTVSNDALWENLSDIEKFDELNSSIEDETDEKAVERMVAEREALIEKVLNGNRNNLYGVLFFTLRAVNYMEPADIMTEIEKFPEELRDNEMMQPVKSYVEAVLRTAEGSDYLEIEADGTKGGKIKLSSVVGEGKWVLVDFWATWCGPCRGELPYLKAAYEKYADRGFEIYGVSLDNDIEGWASFVEENGMTWVNVLDDGGEATSVYGVQSIPTNFLISPDGKIAAKNLRGEEVEAKLAEIFK